MLPEDGACRSRLLRSARLLLDWSQARLACEVGVSTGTVYAAESGRLNRKSSTVLAVVQALQRGGVEFMPPVAGQGHGVRYACAGGRHRKAEDAMAQGEFVERLRQLVGEAEAGGLAVPEMIKAMQGEAEAMQIAYEE